MLFEGFDQIQNGFPYTNNREPITINFNNGEAMEGIGEKEKGVEGSQKENEEDNIFKTEEIMIEEMAIDGICGVY
jgi:mycofactocin precursor